MRVRSPVLSVSALSVVTALTLAPPASSTPQFLSWPEAPPVETIPGTCQSYDTDEQVSVTFIDQGGPKRLHLLLDSTVVRPGAQLRLAPRNLSRRPVSYGLATGAEEAGTGRVLAGTGFFVLLVGLSAEPGEVGPCATLNVPNTAPLGDYQAVLEDVDGAGLSDEDLKAPFTIAGEPLDAGTFVRAGARTVGPRVDRKFTERELNRASNRIVKGLRDEPASSWGIGYRNHRRLNLEITELTVTGLDRISRLAKVPLHVRVASGP